jgi:hypothetical protein
LELRADDLRGDRGFGGVFRQQMREIGRGPLIAQLDCFRRVVGGRREAGE